MDNNKTTVTRRCFVGLGVATLVASPIPIALGLRRATAAELPRLDESDETAKALGYIHDAGAVDASTRGGAERICRSCRFYTEPTAESWGPCTLFPGKAVNAKGWCKSWIVKAG